MGAQDQQAIAMDVEERAKHIKQTLVKLKGENGKMGTLVKPSPKLEKDKSYQVVFEGQELFKEEYGAQLEYCVPTEQFEMFREVFAMMDIDHGGTIELDELMLALESIGLKLPKKVAAKLVEEADSDNTGDIDFAEFLKFMTSCRSLTSNRHQQLLYLCRWYTLGKRLTRQPQNVSRKRKQSFVEHIKKCRNAHRSKKQILPL